MFVISIQVFAAKDVINFGLIPTESSIVMEERTKPFLNEMEKFLGIKVKPFYASDYAGIIEAMRFGKIDIAWFGNKSAIEAVDRAGGEVIVQTVKDDGTKGYYSHLITHKDSGITYEDVLKCGKKYTFGNGDPHSTSGNAIPGYYVFSKNNIDPEQCFSRVTVSNHEGNAIAVATKKVDIATNNNESLERLASTHPELAKNIKVIWTSPMIPSDPIVIRKSLDEGLKQKIVYFLIQFGRYGSLDKIKHERKILENTVDGWGPFLASSNGQLVDVRTIIAYKKLISAKSKNDYKEIEKLEKELKELEEMSKLFRAGY
jgi:phosphonate transport system substrate-binding protein